MIVIDRGHWTGAWRTHDPGAISLDKSITEAAICQVVGWQVAKDEQNVGLLPMSVALFDRAHFIEKFEEEVEAVVSIHMNADARGIATGTEVLIYPTDERKDIAARRISNIVSRTLGLRDRGIKYRPELHLLRRVKVPVFLVEMGFITNPLDTDRVVNFGARAIGLALEPVRDYIKQIKE